MTAYEPPPGSIPTLPVPDLAGLRRTHLVGIGGAGMSGIATLLMARGVQVTGSDLKDGVEVERVRSQGAVVSIGHDAGNVGEADAVVISTAIRRENPEVREADARSIPVYLRAQVLASLLRQHARTVAVAGTHGKTTTTSMLAHILERAGLDPTYVIGGDLNESGSNARSGGGDIAIAEADESDGSFLLLSPEVAIITNVDADHLDFYGSQAQVDAAFVEFAAQARHVIACGDDPGVRRILPETSTAVTTYGIEPGADIRVDVVGVAAGGSEGAISLNDQELKVTVSLPGSHHVLNAAAAIAAAARMGLAPATAAEALRSFAGVRRRFDLRGTARGATFVDDYAHHPAEIRATLEAAGADGAQRVVAVFQPHRYSRTAVAGRELGASLAAADVIVLTEVYAAGELAIPGVSARLVLEGVLEAAPGKRVVFLPRRSDLASFLAREVRPGDLVLTLGAGDVTTVADETIARMSA